MEWWFSYAMGMVSGVAMTLCYVRHIIKRDVG